MRARRVELAVALYADGQLRLALALTALMSTDLADARAQSTDARDDARAIGDPVFEAAALACGALALTAEAASAEAGAADEAAAAALERLSPAQLATRLPAFWMIAPTRFAFTFVDEEVEKRVVAIIQNAGTAGASPGPQSCAAMVGAD